MGMGMGRREGIKVITIVITRFIKEDLFTL